MRVKFGVVDELHQWKEEKEIMFKHKMRFDLVEDIGVVCFESFAEMIIDVIPSDESIRKRFFQEFN